MLTYDIVIKNYRLLKNHNINVNVLTVLTSILSLNPKKYYDWLINNEIEYVQLIPNLQGIEPYQFFTFYKELYNHIITNNSAIRVGLFDNIESILNGEYPQQCGMLGHCAMQTVIEANGHVYPCDFYCLDEFKLGNIHEDSFDIIFKNSRLINFLDKEVLTSVCLNCPVKQMCHGNCKALRKVFIKEDTCGYQQLLLHILQGRR